jgi:plastocyanin
MARVQRLVPVAIVALALSGACSNSTKVGSGLHVNDATPTSACRLGECTTTTAAPPTTAAARSATTQTTARPTTTTRPVTTTTARAVVYVVKIYPDSAGQQFQPRVATFKAGTVVRWTNTDSVPRSVAGDNGEFTSPSLAPGASFEWTPPAPGTINYHDGTRPYAVGTLDVH